MKKIIIVGSGISGLFIANLLRKDSNYEITIYEKNNFVDLEKGYGIQLSVNSIRLLNEIGFQTINSQYKFNPGKIDFYSLKDNHKICELDISLFNTEGAKYTTLQRSTLIEFLKNKIPTNLIQYNKKINKINYQNKNIELIFDDNSETVCDYLIISDGIFSTTKTLVSNKYVRPKYLNSVAVRGTIEKKNIKKINSNNISLFLGSNLHSVIYPLGQGNEFNFITVLRKNYNEDKLKNNLLFNSKEFISSIISDISTQIDKEILKDLRNIRCFPIFANKKIHYPKQNNIFLIGDALFAFPPTFAQGASHSIEVAYELYANLKNDNKDFNNMRIKRINRIRMINKRSKFNHFIFHLSNPIMISLRNILMKYLVKNKKFLNIYLDKIYNN